VIFLSTVIQEKSKDTAFLKIGSLINKKRMEKDIFMPAIIRGIHQDYGIRS